ncbi:MAG: prolipoprotein diacylglyceryl transferase [Patescibacteria group bacterium]
MNLNIDRPTKLLFFLFSGLAILLFYPFQLFFEGKWQLQSHYSLYKFQPSQTDANWNSIYETITQLGLDNLSLRFYSLTLFIGLLLAFWLMIDRFKSLNWTSKQVDSLFVSLLILGILGSRALFVLLNLNFFSEKPIEIINLYQGGLSLYGGIIVCTVYLLLRSRLNFHKFLSFTDNLTPSALLVLIFGRFGNFFNYESYGPKTNDLPWKMYVPQGAINNNRYSTTEGPDFFHPTFLYEMSGNIILLFLILVGFRKFELKKGLISGLFCFFYGLIRFFLEYLRLDAQKFNNLITFGQLFSIVLAGIGLVLIIFSFYDNSKRDN